jgi:apolipoprotein N-acyltransferase
VPFGEFTPFERLFPWLTDIIGMGRSLTAGREFTVFELPRGARAGVNICYEDIFPEISRQFVRRGANVLMTLTNDAWYAESAGSRQHLIHAVFRATENRRPLLRAGNNSDTCLILPDGRIVGLLYDLDTGSRFVRAARCYDVPVWQKQELTFYTRYGDVFAYGCALAMLLTWVFLAQRCLIEKRRRLLAITGSEAAGGTASPDGHI